MRFFWIFMSLRRLSRSGGRVGSMSRVMFFGKIRTGYFIFGLFIGVKQWY